MGQVVFSETFDEAAGSVAGVDNTGGVAWSATCITCLAGDYWEVQGGVFEGLDTNGPAVWETGLIDISSCSFIEISFDLAESGTMEACGTGCNSVDWVQLEYNIDGTGWQVPGNAYNCPGPCADVDVIQSDDITGGSMLYSTGCLIGGGTLQLRITVQTWAGTEIWQVDNVTVQCATGPAVDAGVDQTICDGQSVTLTASNPDAATISWDNGVTDGLAFTPSLGTLTYTVTATDPSTLCSNTDDVDVTVVSAATATINPAGPFNTSSGIQTITGSPAGGTWTATCGACIDPSTGEFDPAIAGAGTWQVCYTVGVVPCDDMACTDVDVTGGCTLTSTISYSDPTCFSFSDGSVTINTTGASGAMIFTISDSLGNPINVGNSNTANNLAQGWYYTNVIDDLLCEASDSIYIESAGELAIDLIVENPLCHGLSTGLAFVDSVYNATGNYGQISYFWSPNPGGINGIGADSLENLTEGSYNLIINDENGCSNTFDFTIEWPDSLYFQELGYDPAYCRLFYYQSGNGVVFASAGGGTGNFSYQWMNLADSVVSSNTTWGGLNPGDYEITVNDDNGCSLIQVITVDSLNPIANFDLFSNEFDANYEGIAVVDVHFTNLSENFANPNNPSADTTFFWNFGFENEPWQISHDLFQEYDTSYTEEGTYQACLVAQNKNGCTDTLCVPIIIYEPLAFAPVNVFTPNGDGVNDVFTFELQSKSVAEFECTIVNRWGIVMYEMNSINDSWDGNNLNGKECLEGVYFYIYTGSSNDGTTFSGQGNIQLFKSE